MDYFKQLFSSLQPTRNDMHKIVDNISGVLSEDDKILLDKPFSST